MREAGHAGPREACSPGAERPVYPMIGTARGNGSSIGGSMYMAVEAGPQQERVAEDPLSPPASRLGG